MSLSGSQFREIHSVLLSAFDRDGLRVMVRVEMDLSLDTVISDKSFSTSVFELISWAERTGKVADLIQAAYRYNPTNPGLAHLMSVSDSWGLRTSLLQPRNESISATSEIGIIDAFLSYDAIDSEFAFRLKEDLESAGIRCWSEDSSSTDSARQLTIKSAIRSARSVIIVMSSTSIKLQAETRLAFGYRIRIFPVLASGSSKSSVPSSLVNYPIVDFNQGYSSAVSKLITELKQYLGVTVSALESYSQARGGGQPLNEAKLILVGFGAVGKTSLTKQLIRGEFNDKEPETPGIQRLRWALELSDGDTVQVNVWDFGGQEILHATHQIFLTKDTLYLLVLAGRQGHEDDDAEYWLNIIRTFGGNSPVVVVLNKVVEHPFTVDRLGLMSKYPQITAILETDCAEPRGIEELRARISRELSQLDYVHATIPTVWFDIKNRLSSLQHDYLSIDRYREICSEYTEMDEEAQDDLLGLLHRLGIVLSFDNDPTRVLNPEWVTEGIYAVLRTVQRRNQNGEIRLSQLSAVLDPRRYPVDRHRFLLELMSKFELSFRIPEQEDRYLIPGLLDNQLPPQASEFDAERCLGFRYAYPTLPESVMPRFIARTHVLSDSLPRWQRGVILEFENNRALVKSDKRDKTIDILINGPIPTRRNLLAIIRSDFVRINEPFSQTPQELVPYPKYPGCVLKYTDLALLDRMGKREYEIVLDEALITVPVRELLGAVDLPEARIADTGRSAVQRPLRLFYSYSHKDEDLRNELETHLKLLQRQNRIQMWSDRKIMPGDDWKGRISAEIESADMILLLVSADFIASDYCYDIEMKRALQRDAEGDATVIPIILRDVDWTLTPFSRLQALPKDAKAVKRWRDRDSAWRNVAEGIRRSIEQRWNRNGQW